MPFTIHGVSSAEVERVFDLVERLYAELDDGSGEFERLDRQATRRDLEGQETRFSAFLARAETGEPLGVLTLSETFAIYAGGCYGVIDELYVVPEARSRGVGLALVEAATGHARERGWRRVDVTAPAGDAWKRSVAFYERAGFVHTGPKLRLDL